MFLKEFNYSVEMHKMRRKYNNNLLRYGLIGEEKVCYELNKISDFSVCLYNIRLFYKTEKAQFDFIVILHDIILIIEVKNLLGNLIIREDYTFEREVYNNGVIQKSGMDNPFIQIDYHEQIFKKCLKEHNCNKEVRSILVMANDKMLITNFSNRKDIIKYDELIDYIMKMWVINELTNEDYEIGRLLLNGDKEYNYNILPIIKRNLNNQYTPKFESEEDLNLFIKVIKVRSEYSQKNNIPICNVFNNKEAELLVINKPTTKDEFVSIKGFKEKRYQMYGEEIIKIFKNS